MARGPENRADPMKAVRNINPDFESFSVSLTGLDNLTLNHLYYRGGRENPER